MGETCSVVLVPVSSLTEGSVEFGFTQQELVSDLKSAGTIVTRTTTGNLSVVSTVFGMKEKC